VLEAWNKHAIRDLPTILFPEPPTSNFKASDPGKPTTTSTGVTLRTTKHQEVFTYFRPLYPYITPSSSPPGYTISKPGAPDYDASLASRLPEGKEPFAFYRSEGGAVLDALPAVRPSVLFMHGGTSDLSTPELRSLRVSTCGVGPGGSGGAKEGRVADVVMEDKGHLFPMEVPGETAAHTAKWLKVELARWRHEQAEYEAWTRLPMRQKTALSQEFIDKVGRPKTRPKKAAESKL
jgi:hypothetical protein